MAKKDTATGFILIRTKPNTENKICEQLKDIPEVIEMYKIADLRDCKYNILAKIKTDDYYEMGKIVIERIRKNVDVLNTETLGVIIPWGNAL